MNVSAKWWEVVPAGATLSRISPMDGKAFFKFQGKTLCCDLFTDTVIAMETTTDSSFPILPREEWADRSMERWRSEVASGTTTEGYKDWADRYGPAQIVAIGKVDVYVYIDPTDDKVTRVVVDDCSLGDSDDMVITLASKDEVPLNYSPPAEMVEHAKKILDSKLQIVWPGWDFGW